VVPPTTATPAVAVAVPRPPLPPPVNVAGQHVVTFVQDAALATAQHWQRELTFKVAQLQSERAKLPSLLASQSDALVALQRRQPLDDNLEDELYDADDLNERLAAALQSSNAPSPPSRLYTGVEFQTERWNSSVEPSTRGIYPEYNMMLPPFRFTKHNVDSNSVDLDLWFHPQVSKHSIQDIDQFLICTSFKICFAQCIKKQTRVEQRLKVEAKTGNKQRCAIK
jgi:hypothetical protein